MTGIARFAPLAYGSTARIVKQGLEQGCAESAQSRMNFKRMVQLLSAGLSDSVRVHPSDN